MIWFRKEIFEILVELAKVASMLAALVLGVLLVLMQVCVYPVAIVRWFREDHHYFWEGFKDLLWALCPIANFFYVWDLIPPITLTAVIIMVVVGVYKIRDW